MKLQHIIGFLSVISTSIIIQFGTATGNSNEHEWRNFPTSFSTTNIKLIPWYHASTSTVNVLTDIFYKSNYDWTEDKYLLFTPSTLPTHYYIAIGY